MRLLLATPLLFANIAIAQTHDIGGHRCSTAWSVDGLHVSCTGFTDAMLADPAERPWRRTGLEVLAYDGTHRKWFCTLDQTPVPGSTYVYAPEAVYCSYEDGVVETLLHWTGTNITPEIGVTFPFNLRVNEVTADGKEIYDLYETSNFNDPATAGSFTLAENNVLGESPPSTPWMPKTELKVTWDEQEADYFQVYIKRGDESLPPVHTTTNELELHPYVLEGTAAYEFQVSAHITEPKSDSGLSDSYTTWIAYFTEPANDCPETPVAPPTCPDCPPVEDCPDTPDCPVHHPIVTVAESGALLVGCE